MAITVKQAMDKELDAHCLEEVHKQCVVTTDGQRVRGFVPKIRCHGCGHERWDDGTPCRQPGSHGNKYCGKRHGDGLDAMEDGREG